MSIASTLGIGNLGLKGGGANSGLKNFIAEIRACTTKEAEQARVDEEMANIRAKFSNSASLTPYQKKKYVWKMVYIFMLGYDVDFGHMEVINLISATTFGEKNCGYVATQVLLKNTDEMMTLVVNSIRNDLISVHDWSQTLALACIANMGGAQMAETLGQDVQRVLVSPDTKPVVRKKAALCMLRLFRVAPDTVQAAEWVPRLIALFDDRHLGVLLCTLSLLLELVKHDAAGYVELRPHCILLLSRLVMHKACTVDYLYYSTPSPWLQVKILQVLQYFPPPPDQTQRGRLNESLRKIVTKTEVTKSVNKNNGDHSILFEAVNLVVSQGTESDPQLRQHSIVLLGKYLSVLEPNIRYLGLETMSRLVQIDAETAAAVRSHQATVLFALKDNDISVRRRALDLLFMMCDRSNSLEIVEELINYLVLSDASIREEMVLKIAILAETFAADFRWYVDTMLKLVTIAGDYVADDVWYRTVQIITNDEDLQRYAAEVLFRAVQAPQVHDTALSITGYVLGEFGFLIADQPGMSGGEQFAALNAHFNAAARDLTRALLLTTYSKMLNLYDDLAPQILPVFSRHRAVVSEELQQRSIEYANLPNDEGVMRTVLEAMPAFPENRESSLMTRLKNTSEQTQDRAKWAESKRAAAGSADDQTAGESNDDEGYVLPGTRPPAASIGGGNGEAGAGAEPEFAPLGGGGNHGGGSSAVHGASGGGGGDGGGGGSANLLDMDDEPPAPPAQHAMPPSGPAAGFDPLAASGAVGGMAAAPAAGGGPAVTIPETMLPQLRAWFGAVGELRRGVLFENKLLQIGVASEFRDAAGAITLFFQNNSGAPLGGFSVVVAEVDYLRVQVEPIAAPVLAPGVQTRVQVRVSCVKPFSSSPELVVSFVTPTGQTHRYNLRLPVVVASFFTPVAIPGQQFIQKWQALAGPEREAQEAFTSPRVDVARARALLVDNFHMALAPGVDTTDATVTAGSMFRTSTPGPNGEPISVGALLRLELNPAANAYRVTVRAVNGTVAQALKNIVKDRLLA